MPKISLMPLRRGGRGNDFCAQVLLVKKKKKKPNALGILWVNRKSASFRLRLVSEPSSRRSRLWPGPHASTTIACSRTPPGTPRCSWKILKSASAVSAPLQTCEQPAAEAFFTP